MTIKIRRAVPEDAETLANLVHELNLYHKEDMRPEPSKLRADWGHFDAYLAELDGKDVGFVVGFSFYQFHTAKKRYEINNIHVSKAYRRRGIMRKLLHYVVCEQHAVGVEKFFLGVNDWNNVAIAFYDAVGFESKPMNGKRLVLKDENLQNFMEITP